MRMLLQAVLRELNYTECLHVANGEEAVLAYRKFHPDLVFLDIDMPVLSGLEALAQIRAVDAQAYVVMISASASIQNVKRALAAGVNGFVVKPYSPQRVEEVLKDFPLRPPLPAN
jgi:two-component system chemotaxis response regulator CheY